MGGTGLLPYQRLVSFRPPVTRYPVVARELQLYALSLGAGAALPSETALGFVYEKGLIPLSTYYTILTWRDPRWLADIGVTMPSMVHLSESLEVHAPPPADGQVEVVVRIADVTDKGAGRGALIGVEFSIDNPDTGSRLADARSVLYCRADGGIEGAPPAPPRREKAAAPTSAPDGSISIPTRLDQAALYRLCGDMNPIHIDPEVAGQAGFDRPLLHGLCTYGMVYLALLRGLFQGDQARIRRFDVDFTGPVYPGDSLQVDYWLNGSVVRFVVCSGHTRQVLGGTLLLN